MPTRSRERARVPGSLPEQIPGGLLIARHSISPLAAPVAGCILMPAMTAAMLYMARWSIELFFRWIKSHLRIKHYHRPSPNAVKAQIRIGGFMIFRPIPRTSGNARTFEPLPDASG